MINVSDKVAIVTGGASGMGQIALDGWLGGEPRSRSSTSMNRVLKRLRQNPTILRPFTAISPT